MKRRIKLLAVASSCFALITACGKHEQCTLSKAGCEEDAVPEFVKGCFTESLYIDEEYGYYTIPGGICLEGPTANEESCATMSANLVDFCPQNFSNKCEVNDFYAYYYENLYSMVPCEVFTYLNDLNL